MHYDIRSVLWIKCLKEMLKYCLKFTWISFLVSLMTANPKEWILNITWIHEFLLIMSWTGFLFYSSEGLCTLHWNFSYILYIYSSFQLWKSIPWWRDYSHTIEAMQKVGIKIFMQDRSPFYILHNILNHWHYLCMACKTAGV